MNPLKFDVTAVLENLERRGHYPTVQFQNPLNLHGEPSKFPIVTNLWATRERCAEAIGLPRGKAGSGLGTFFAEFVNKKIEPVRLFWSTWPKCLKAFVVEWALRPRRPPADLPVLQPPLLAR